MVRSTHDRSGVFLAVLLVAAQSGLAGCDDAPAAGRADAGRDATLPSDGGARDAGGADAGGVSDAWAADAPASDVSPADAATPDRGGDVGTGGYCGLPALVPTIGYAAHKSVSGGLVHCAAPTTVQNLSDSGAGSLREAIASDRYVVFAPALKGGTITLASDLVKADISNLTLDGRAPDGSSLGITLTSHALKLDGPQNVVVGYLRFEDNDATAETDGLTMRGRVGRTPTFYVVHNTFINAADGALDIIWKRGSDVWGTLEANHFRCNDKTLLINSSGDVDPPDEGAGRYHITMVRNWFEQNVQRQPLARATDLHYLNNVITEEANGGKAPDAGREAHYLIEDNAFESGSGGAHCRLDTRTGRRFILIGGPDALVTERGNLLLDGGSGQPYHDDKQGTGFIADALTPPYPYSRTPMTPALMQDVMGAAGCR